MYVKCLILIFHLSNMWNWCLCLCVTEHTIYCMSITVLTPSAQSLLPITIEPAQCATCLSSCTAASFFLLPLLSFLLVPQFTHKLRTCHSVWGLQIWVHCLCVCVCVRERVTGLVTFRSGGPKAKVNTRLFLFAQQRNGRNWEVVKETVKTKSKTQRKSNHQHMNPYLFLQKNLSYFIWHLFPGEIRNPALITLVDLRRQKYQLKLSTAWCDKLLLL